MGIVPSKAQWKKWSLPAKASYVGAVVGVPALAVALIALIPDRGKTPASKIDTSASELIALLNVRADEILHRMETEESERLTAFRVNPHASCPKFASEADLRSRMAATRQLFQQLHDKNIQAIKDGQLIVAHDLTRDIHLLLYMRHRELFCETATRPPPGVAYKRRDPYPGPTACDLEQKELDRKKVVVGWIENVRNGHADPRSCSGGLSTPPGRDAEGQTRIEKLLNPGAD